MPSFASIAFLFLTFFATAHAFGAGSIPPSSPVKGTNWLHGDVTSVLLSIPKAVAPKAANFSEHDVKIIYFGSWLRDLSQVIDNGVLKLVPEAVLRAVVGVLAYVEFGKSTGEFEVTKERLGVYRHEEHIDNPKGYVVEGNYELDPRLRTKIETKEYEADDVTGMLHLVASEGKVEFTAAGYVRKMLKDVIRLGREGRRRKDESMVHEAYIRLGGVLHVLDDFAAHSNYVELALHLLGEKGVFLYTGDKAVRVGPEGRQVAPLVTGTFGTEDLWHSLLGTVNDKAATQGIEHPQTSLADLEDRLKDARSDIGGSSAGLLDQLSQVPGIIPNSLREFISSISRSSEEFKEQDDLKTEERSKDIDEKIRKLEAREEAIKEPEETTGFPLSNLAWSTTDLDDGPNWASISTAPGEFLTHIQPILELQQSISDTLSNLPSFDSINIPNISLPQDFDFSPILARISSAVDSAAFSFISPYMLPVVQKLRETLTVASHDMLDREGNQFDVFRHDSDSLCPSHSLLSKDHFTNVLQHPAGLVAEVMTQLAVKAVVEAWDAQNTDEQEYARLFRSNTNDAPSSDNDAEKKCIDFILGALHHPYYVHSRTSSSNKMHSEMLLAVQTWWTSQPAPRKRELRHVLSKSGVERGLNHRCSPETQLRGHWLITSDDIPVIKDLHGWSTRRRRAWRAENPKEEKGSVINDVIGVVEGVRKDPVGTAWRFAQLVAGGQVTPAGLYKDGWDTAKGVWEEFAKGEEESTDEDVPTRDGGGIKIEQKEDLGGGKKKRKQAGKKDVRGGDGGIGKDSDEL